VPVGRLAGRVCVVTGATKGIGAVVARRFVAEGASVAAVGRDEARGEALAAELGAEAAFVRADLTADGAAEACVAAAVERFGRVDVLVNNAGMDYVAPLLDAPADDVREVLETNLVAPFLLLQAAARHLRERGAGGAIVNVASRLGVIGNPRMGVYGASKGGLLALTRHAAVELAPLGIRVNAVAPGLTETPLMTAWLEGSPEGTRERALAGIPQGRFGRPEDVANAILFLASDEAAHVTGATLAVDGGYTAA
jgi:NAD(P)-dependent dehydrogenase (short-subunit alcohol dehydrogenase family)